MFWAQNVPSEAEGKEKEHRHAKKALKTCGYPNQAFMKSAKIHRKEHRATTREKQNDKLKTISHFKGK